MATRKHDPSAVGARIKAARKQRDFTQRELSSLTQIDQATLSRMESGDRDASIAQLIEIARHTGADASWLVGLKPTAAMPSPTAPRSLPSTPDDVADDKALPTGLRSLAKDEALHAPLKIKAKEWRALASLKPSGQIDKNGYASLLLALRSVTKL